MSIDSKKRILFIAPSYHDRSQFHAIDNCFEIIPYRGALDTCNLCDLNVESFLEEAIAFVNDSDKTIDGVTSTDDYPGSLLAALLARELNFKYIPDIKSLLKAQHKVVARSLNEKTLAEYLNRWSRYSFDEKPALEFPFFIRPSKGVASMFAQKVTCENELAAYQKKVNGHFHHFCGLFNQIWEEEIGDGDSTECFLIEELVENAVQVTVDGFVFDGEAKALGVTDSIMFPGTISFQRFDYPSHLDNKATSLLKKVAEQAVLDCEINNSMWNVELFYHPETGRCTIIEINPRMAFQFSDLYEMVDGVNLYNIQLQIACGIKPVWKEKQGPYKASTSYVLREFEDKRIIKMPTQEKMKALSKEFPLLRILFFGGIKEGQMISEATINDVASFRYAFINMGGQDWKDVDERINHCKDKMGLILEDCKVYY